MARKRKPQAGFILPLALLGVGICLLLAAIGLSRSMTEQVASQFYVAKQQALHFADGGLDLVAWEPRQPAGGAFQEADANGNPLWATIQQVDNASPWYAECDSGWTDPPAGKWPCQARTLPIANGAVDIVVKGAQSPTPRVALIGRTNAVGGRVPGLASDGFIIDAQLSVSSAQRPFLYTTYGVATAMAIYPRVKVDSYDSSLGDYGAFLLGKPGWAYNRSDDTKDIVSGKPIGDTSTWKAVLRSNSNTPANPLKVPQPFWNASVIAQTNYPYLPLDAWGAPEIWGSAVVGVPAGYAAPAMDINEITSYVGSFPYASPPAGEEGWRRFHTPSDPQGTSPTNGFSSSATPTSTPAVVFPVVSTTGAGTLSACPAGPITIDYFNANYSAMNLPDSCSLIVNGDGTLHLIRDSQLGRNTTVRFTGTNVAILVDAAPAPTCPTCTPRGSLGILPGARLNLDSNTTLKLYLKPLTGFISSRNTQVNPTGKPTQFTIYAANDPMNPMLIGVANSSDKPFTSEFRGNIYAPDNDIQVGCYTDASLAGLIKFYGSIVARKITVGFQGMHKDNHIEMHFDTAPDTLSSGLAGAFGGSSTVRVLVWNYRVHD